MLERWTSTWALRLGAATLAFSLVGCSSDDPPAPAGGGGDTPRRRWRQAHRSSSNRDAGGATVTPKGDAGGSTTTPPKDAGGKPPTGSPDGGGTAPGTGTDGGGTVTVNPGKCDATAAPDVGKLGLQTVPGATGLTKLVFAAQPPGSTDWYFLEQTGAIKVLTGGAIKATPFLNLSSKISLMNIPGVDDERGLLGLAFPPDYATSGKFYVMMTPSGNTDTVYEFARSAADPYVADPTETKTLLTLPMSAFNHNSGNVVVGKDGMLYVGTGDGGGSCNDNQSGAPQDTKKLFGKILGSTPTRPLHPTALRAIRLQTAAAAIRASGCSACATRTGSRFDRANDDLYIGDVGQDAYEELDYVAAGGKGLNFGWPGVEGLHPGTCAGKTLPAGATPTAPIFEADRRRGQTGPLRGLDLRHRRSRLPRQCAAAAVGRVHLWRLPGRPHGRAATVREHHLAAHAHPQEGRSQPDRRIVQVDRRRPGAHRSDGHRHRQRRRAVLRRQPQHAAQGRSRTVRSTLFLRSRAEALRASRLRVSGFLPPGQRRHAKRAKSPSGYVRLQWLLHQAPPGHETCERRDRRVDGDHAKLATDRVHDGCGRHQGQERERGKADDPLRQAGHRRRRNRDRGERTRGPRSRARARREAARSSAWSRPDAQVASSA